MAGITEQDINITKNNTKAITAKWIVNSVETEFVDGDTVYFSIKEKISDTSYTLQKIITSFTAEGYADCTLSATETDTFDECTYWYDMKLVKANGEEYTFIKGRLIIDKDEITG